MKNKRTGKSGENISSKIPYPLFFPILIPLIFPFFIIGVIVTLLVPSEPPVRYIKVNGKDCVVKYVKDRCNSHGGCIGHDEAICP